MRVNLVNENLPFKKIVETFRRETTSVWQDGVNPEVVNTNYDTFEYTQEDKEEEKEKKDGNTGSNKVRRK